MLRADCSIKMKVFRKRKVCICVCMQFCKFKFKRTVLNKISNKITSLMAVTTELFDYNLAGRKMKLQKATNF
jgi:hypothetical protein